MFRIMLALIPLLVAFLASPAFAATVRIGVVENKAANEWGFDPAVATIGVGDTVVFVNDGTEPHDFISLTEGFPFGSPVIDPGGTFLVTFDRPGRVRYICDLHPNMEGAIVVREAAPAPATAADFPIAGGHFFTQTGGGGGKGYAVTDEGGVRFWSEFQRLGGVQAVGYPASQRFEWDGFTVQVFQRVIFQWRPESNGVAFVNVFDRLAELGRDEWLLRTKQTPPAKQWDEAGKSWDQIVAGRLAVLDAWPAIKAKYFDVVGDPIQANGLPVSDVVDMGNHYALRAQRVVFQQWKEDVPWARRGEVTVALGGDIAKEAGILPAPAALEPVERP